MPFTFSIRQALRESWEMYKRHILFFVVLTLVLFILEMTHGRGLPILTALGGIAAVIWGYVTYHVLIEVAYRREAALTLRNLSAHLPNIRQFFGIIGVSLVSAVLMLVALLPVLLVLVIPSGMVVRALFIAIGVILALYILIRLFFARFIYVERGSGIISAVRSSWDLVNGPIFWKVLWTVLVSGLIMLVGFLFFGFGALVTYPLGMLIWAILYRELVAYQQSLASHE